MAGAAPAYSYYPERVREGARPQRQARPQRPDITVVPGSGHKTQTISPSVVFLAKTVAAVLIFIAMMSFARIALSSAAVSTSVASQDVSSNIAEARSVGSTLEVQVSTLSNPGNLKTAATEIGMHADTNATTLVLPRDVVATDAAGNLSFAESVRVASGAVS